MSKNLQKVQDMMDGNFKRKIQSGYTPDREEHKVGDKWTDADDVQWEQKNGYRSKITRTANVGIAEKCRTCSDYIIKDWDKDVHRLTGNCYHCQLNFELDLKYDKPIRHFAWRRLKDFENMEAIEKDFERWLDEKEKLDKEKVFDDTVANAIANENVEMTINKNKAMTK
tara:strand:- start:398 stop:904 length:507 start_codon:yes stop_codon:yes gene_type:complete